MLLGVVEDQAKGRLLSSVEAQHFRQQNRPEACDCGAHRHTDALGAQREEVHGKGGCLPVVAGLLSPSGDLVATLTGFRQPGHIAFHIRHQHRHARCRQLLGDHLQRLGFAGTGGAGHQPMTVDGGQRDANLRRRVRLTVDDDCTQLQGLALDGVAGRNLLGGRRWRFSAHIDRCLFPDAVVDDQA